MSQFALGAAVALLVYLAIRVMRIKRQSLPFLVAYPVFVAILVGGGVALFIAVSHAVAALGYGAEDPIALVSIYGVTAVGLLVLWWVARRVIR